MNQFVELIVLCATLASNAVSIPPVANTSTDRSTDRSTNATPSSAAHDAEVNFRTMLLDVGFAAASAIPSKPHEKDRAKAQEVVAAACLELGMQSRAAGFANQIISWRKGSVYGDLAIDAAKNARVDAAKLYATMALRAVAGEKDWRRDVVVVKVAQAHAWLGDEAQAASMERGVADSEKGKVDAVRVAKSAPENFDADLTLIEVGIATKNLDIVRNSIEAALELARRAGADEARWTRVNAVVALGMPTLPRDMQIDIMLRFADVRAKQSATNPSASIAARAFVDAAIKLRDGASWTPDSASPLAAMVARRLALLGDIEAAKTELDSARALFDREIEMVPDVFRASALRPLAQGYAALMDASTARAVFARAIAEGARNPNARPRAEDLACTCAAMALAGIEPDAAMWESIRATSIGLKDPW